MKPIFILRLVAWIGCGVFYWLFVAHHNLLKESGVVSLGIWLGIGMGLMILWLTDPDGKPLFDLKLK